MHPYLKHNTPQIAGQTVSCAESAKRRALRPLPERSHLEPLNPQPQILNPKSQTLNLNLKP